MAEEWRNPWAPVPGAVDDESAESSFSHSQPIEPGLVVEAAPQTIFGEEGVRPAPPAVAPPTVAPPAAAFAPPAVAPPTVAPPAAAFAPPAPPAATPPPQPVTQTVVSPTVDLLNSASISNTVDREDFDRTVMSRVESRLWRLSSRSSETEKFSVGSIVVGRNPRLPIEHRDAQLVVVDDPTRTVSKTHALFEFIGGAWYVTDLDSTNGVILVDVHGAKKRTTSGQRVLVTPQFLLGDLNLWLTESGSA